MDNQQERPSDLEIGWLVGAIESEGCFSVLRHTYHKGNLYYNLLLIISNTNSKFIEKVARILKKAGVGHHIRWRSVEQLQAYNKRAKRPQATVTIWGQKRLRPLLDLTSGLWGAKAGQVECIEQAIKLGSPRRGPEFEKLWKACSDLNQGILTDFTPKSSN